MLLPKGENSAAPASGDIFGDMNPVRMHKFCQENYHILQHVYFVREDH